MLEPVSAVILSGGVVGVMIQFARAKFSYAKVIFDYTFSILILVLLFPFYLLIALGVKLTSPGPVFYHQERIGKNGKIFKIYKFRTMADKAERKTGPVWAQVTDPRLTRFGKFLRDRHLDELPQFFNVLKGNMSIIGPRPERPIFVNQFNKEIAGYQKRLEIKPGITGLAQTRQNYDITLEDVKRKVAMDLMYIREMCWLVDIKIFLTTVKIMFTGRVYDTLGTPSPSNVLPFSHSRQIARN